MGIHEGARDVGARRLTMAGIVVLILVLVLLQRNDLRDRLIRLAGDDLHLTTDAMDEVAQRVGRYLRTQLLINVLYGVPMAAGLFLIGVPGALMWGMLAALLRFVPYVGPAIAAMFPLVLSAAVDPGWTMLLWTALLVITLELVSNNVVEPWLYGASTGLSALAIVVSTIFWTALWGPIGLVLSTPMTVCLAVIGRHVPQWAWLDVLLGNAQPIDDATRLHQRLLAGDVEEAIELATRSIESSGVSDFYSDAAVPALRQAVQSYANAARVEHRHRVNSGMSTLVRTLREEFQGARGPAQAARAVPRSALGSRRARRGDACSRVDHGRDSCASARKYHGSQRRYRSSRCRRRRHGLPLAVQPVAGRQGALHRASTQATSPRPAGARGDVERACVAYATPGRCRDVGVDDIALSLREAVQRVAAWSPGAVAAEVGGKPRESATRQRGQPAPSHTDRLPDLRGQLLRSAQHAAEVFDVPLTVVTLTDPAIRVVVRPRPGGAGAETGAVAAVLRCLECGSPRRRQHALVRRPGSRSAIRRRGCRGPVVTAERLRFFAGTPLELASGVGRRHALPVRSGAAFVGERRTCPARDDGARNGRAAGGRGCRSASADAADRVVDRRTVAGGRGDLVTA